MGLFGDIGEVGGDLPLLRVYVPGTLWTMELALSGAGPEALRGLNAMESKPSAFGCNAGAVSSQGDETRRGWWKTTYMSGRPEIAA
eukprot:CAMPEP_0115407546 /NCGR_PEP_ID=MMETSP0271-20121206/19020_1 /TAXON_ID=71861 /ORGANISM="Scrippsiella trochoidea, Strain CCMP3099" /LENGTH=85 /DNA_ID=CAMNT_0002831617 /DNA_START=1 /DNA_END=254 /DNA_ORIENTATION=-